MSKNIAPAIVSFCPINRTRRFSPARSLASNVASLELLVVHLVFPRTNPCSSRSSVAVMRQRHIRPCTKCILPSLCNSRISGHAPTRRVHWVFVQEMTTHAQISHVRLDARSCLLSLFVLRLHNVLFRSFLAGVQQCAKGYAWRASSQQFCLMFLLRVFQCLLVLSRSEVPELSVVTFCCHVNVLFCFGCDLRQ